MSLRPLIARLKLRLNEDAGASLILVLALMIFASLVVVAMLSAAASGLSTAAQITGETNAAYDADGAVQAAINNIRNSSWNNSPGDPACPSLNYPGSNTGLTLVVNCEGGPDTGGGSTSIVPITAANRPANSIMTLGDAASGEVTGIRKTSTGILRATGPVAVNSAVDASSGGSIVATPNTGETAQLTARGACTGTVTSTPAASCNTGVALADPAIAAPASYTQPSAGMTYQSVPSCPAAAGATVKFSPGYYDNAVGLTSLMSTCTGRTFWFQPATGGGVGVYYFDFHNGLGGVPAGSRIWTVNNTTHRIVGGKASGWNPDAVVREVPTIPGSCVSPLLNTTNDGVEFVFGGDSRMVISRGQMELCGQYYANKPPIAIYGAKTGADTISGPTALNPSSSSNTAGTVAFANQPNIWGAGDATATITNGAPNNVANVTVTGYGGATIPAGSILTNAVLAVRHKETNTASSLNAFNAYITGTGGTALRTETITRCTTAGSACGYLTDTSANLSSFLATEVHNNGLTGLSVRINPTVAATGTRNVTVALDSVILTLTWRPPAVRAESLTPVNGGVNCIQVKPSTAGGACALITTTGTLANPSKFYVQGTAYAPIASVNHALVGTEVGYRSGAILRKVETAITSAASTAYTDPIFSLPTLGAGANPLALYFSAYSCPPGSTCSSPAPAAPWRLALTAGVSYPATNPAATPVAGDRAVTVNSWSVHQ